MNAQASISLDHVDKILGKAKRVDDLSLNPATYAIELVRWCYFDGAGALAFQSAALVLAAVVSLGLVLAVYSRWTRGEEGR